MQGPRLAKDCGIIAVRASFVQDASHSDLCHDNLKIEFGAAYSSRSMGFAFQMPGAIRATCSIHRQESLDPIAPTIAQYGQTFAMSDDDHAVQ